MKCETISFRFLGTGYPLFFNFIIFSIIILLCIFLQSGAYSLVSNGLGTDCINSKKLNNLLTNMTSIQKEHYIKKKKICTLSLITKYSLANKRNSKILSKPQDYLNLFTVFVVIVVLQFFRYSQRSISQICDSKELTASDYTVIVKGIPNNIPSKN